MKKNNNYVIHKMETLNEIYFYGHKNEYGYLSNFYKTTFIEDEREFNCSEQYFMFRKCVLFNPDNEILIYLILNETSPSVIKNYGRKVKNFDETVWNIHKYDFMLSAVRLKFSQNEIIKQKLLETKPKILYESSKNDKIWGIGYYANDAVKIDKNKFGENLLGKVLMQVRDEF